MPNRSDMAEMITRGELHEALEIWAGNLIATLTAQISLLIQASERRLTDELRRHSNANKEDLEVRISAIDDQYADLPPRVAKLEAKVFAPKRKRR